MALMYATRDRTNDRNQRPHRMRDRTETPQQGPCAPRPCPPHARLLGTCPNTAGTTRNRRCQRTSRSRSRTSC
eukprot:5732651-Prymnesium_polylepis.2